MATEEEQLEELEEELKKLEYLSKDSSLSSAYPEPEKKDNQFKFFREILHLPESWKVGNLKDEEIGKSKLGVRSYLELAQYSEAEGLDQLEKYFTGKADIVAAPTMGRKGFLAQLFVTSIKREQKIKEPSKLKKGWFGGKKNVEEE